MFKYLSYSYIFEKMGKRNLTLYIDDELISLANSKGLNLSKLFNDLIAIELQFKELSDTTTKEELIDKLKTRIALLTDELRVCNEKNKILEDEIKSFKKEIEELKKSKKEDKTKERIVWSQ